MAAELGACEAAIGLRAQAGRCGEQKASQQEAGDAGTCRSAPGRCLAIQPTSCCCCVIRLSAAACGCAGSAGGGLRGAALGSLLLLAGQAVDGCSAHQRPSANTALRRAALLRGDSIGLPLPVQTKPSAATGGHPAIAAAHNRPSTRPGRRSSLLALSNAPRCARHQGTSDSSLPDGAGAVHWARSVSSLDNASQSIRRDTDLLHPPARTATIRWRGNAGQCEASEARVPAAAASAPS